MSNMGNIANMRAAAKAWRANAIASGETIRAHDKIDELIDEIERLRAALQDMIEISTRNSEATLMLIGIRKCAERALEPKP